MMCFERTMSAKRWCPRALRIILVILSAAAWSLFVCGSACATRLTVRGYDLYRNEGQLEPWALEVPGVLASDDLTDDLVANLFRYAEFGVNTVSASLQSASSRAFSADGKRLDRDVARRLRRIVSEANARWMPVVLIPFSADKTAWLAEPESYRNAVRFLARAFSGRDDDTILALGVPAATASRVPEGCPFRLDDVENLLELCRTVKRANRRQLVGVFARDAEAVQAIANSSDADIVFVNDPALLGRARTPEGSGTVKPVVWVESAGLTRDRDALSKSVASIASEPGVYLVARFQSPSAADGTVRRFLEQVRAARLAASINEEAPPNPDAAILTEEERHEGWVALFDGQSLHGWTTLGRDWGAWLVENGTLKCSARGGRWLRTRKRYKDFVLRLEFKLSRNCNSGVFIHAPLDARASRMGMEVQLRDHPRPTVDNQSLGAIYAVLAPRVYAGRPPGEWNELEIVCERQRVIVNLNGHEIQNFTMDDHPLLQGRLSEGYIGLQDHGRPVWFRNIRVKELPQQP